MSQTMQMVLLVVAILAINGLLWAILLPIIRGKGRRQVEKYGSVPLEYGSEPAEHEGTARYLATRVDGGKCFAPGYWVRGTGPVKLTAHALSLQRPGAGLPMLVLREGISKVERRSRFAGRGVVGKRITVIHWEMGGGRFETGLVFAGHEHDRLAWERRLKEPRA